MVTQWVLLIGLLQQGMGQVCDFDLNCSGVGHTNCVYVRVPSAGKCSSQVDLTVPDVRSLLMGLHNYVRNEIAGGKVGGWPPAANMRQLSWDVDLSDTAVLWGFQCMAEENDVCRKTRTFPYVTQSVGFKVASGNDAPAPNITSVLRDWVNEIGGIDPTFNVEAYKTSNRYSRFSSIIWAKTYKVGCGVVGSVYEGKNRTILVCNYGPGGLIPNERMYLSGKDCNKCLPGTSCNPKSSYKFLCATIEDDPDEQPVKIDINQSIRTFPSDIWLTILVGIFSICHTRVNENTEG